MNTKTYNIKHNSATHKNRLTPKRIVLLAVGIILVGGLLYFVISRASHSLRSDQATTKTANQATKGEPNSSTSSGSSQGSTTGSTTPSGAVSGVDEKQTNNSSFSSPLIAPSGNFVSNYAPSLSSESGRNVIQSVCNTTPGATCRISFTRNSETKSLEKRVTDKGGSAYWTWKLQDLDLTLGSWKIEATAELNGKTASTTDTLPLEVKP